MSNFSTLEIGKRALLAQRFGLDVTSNNIANVNTEGYSRRQPTFSQTSPTYTSSGFIGTGAVAQKLRTFRQEFYDKEMRSSISLSAGYASDEKIYGRIETILAEPTDTGINEVVSEFFNSFENLALQPEDLGLREHALGLAKSLTDRFHSTAQKLIDTRDEVLGDIKADIDSMNGLIKGIADLNEKIVATYSQAGQESQTYVDEREVLLEDLSELAGVSVSQGDYGDVNVFINGINVVTGAISSEVRLQETVDSTTGEITATIIKSDEDGNALTTITPDSGELKSLLTHYNITLDENDSSGAYSLRKKLDDFANAIANKVNALTTTGYSLENNTGVNFFEPVVGGVNAMNIEVSDDVKNNPNNIPLSDAPNEPGNNEIALKIALLSSDQNFIENASPSEFYSGVLGRLGTMGNESVNGATSANLVKEQLDIQRESVIGVNLDEEAVNLIKFQKAFEASSRVINTTNDLLGVIINLGR